MENNVNEVLVEMTEDLKKALSKGIPSRVDTDTIINNTSRKLLIVLQGTSDKIWRLKKSAVARQVVNDCTGKIVQIEVDIAQMEARSITISDKAEIEQMALGMRNAKNNKENLERIQRIAESLLKLYEKDETKVD